MSIEPTSHPRSNQVGSNVACMMAMFLWAAAFPAAEVMLETWGVVALGFFRQLLCVCLLMTLWILLDGWSVLRGAPWRRGIWVGGIGFGFGAILLLLGQALSDPVIPAIAAATMPIAGAILEVALDNRKLHWNLVLGAFLALFGGYVATGVDISNGSFGIGAFLCLTAVFLFAWGTRATTRQFESLSTIGQTTITLIGGVTFFAATFALFTLFGFGGASIGLLDNTHIFLLVFSAFVSLALAQLLWIKAAGSLGVFLASFHMNAVPFYVMVIVVLLLDRQWNWIQAGGAALVAVGVLVSQSINRTSAKSRPINRKPA